MSGEIVVAAPPPKPPEIRAGAPVRAIVPSTMEDAYRLAVAIVKAGLTPKGMENTESVMVAIMQGLEVGMPPMTAIQKIAVINGRPTIWGDGALGLVRGSGLCLYVKEWIDGTGDAAVAYCETHRKGEQGPIRRAFSAADAKKAGLWGKAGPWQNYPSRMLQMRARGFALRDLYADVLGGMYIAEELQGEEFHAGTPGARVVPDAPAAPSAPPVPPPAQIAAPTPSAPPPVKDDMPDIPASLDRRPPPKAPETPVQAQEIPTPQDAPTEDTASVRADELATWFAGKLADLKLCKTVDDVEALREEVLDELSGQEPQTGEWKDATAEQASIVWGRK